MRALESSVLTALLCVSGCSTLRAADFLPRSGHYVRELRSSPAAQSSSADTLVVRDLSAGVIELDLASAAETIAPQLGTSGQPCTDLVGGFHRAKALVIQATGEVMLGPVVVLPALPKMDL